MNKQTYLAKLAQLLAPLPEQERQDALNYYEEYFDAAGPEAEDATAAELGDPADAARKILEGEGLMLDSAQAAAGESSDAADTAQDAAPQPTGENPPTTKPELHGPAAIPPVMGVLLILPLPPRPPTVKSLRKTVLPPKAPPVLWMTTAPTRQTCPVTTSPCRMPCWTLITAA